MTTSPDRMGQRLIDAEKAIDAFEKEVGRSYYQNNPTRAADAFAKKTIGILRQQHQIMVMLEDKLAKGPGYGGNAPH